MDITPDVEQQLVASASGRCMFAAMVCVCVFACVYCACKYFHITAEDIGSLIPFFWACVFSVWVFS